MFRLYFHVNINHKFSRFLSSIIWRKMLLWNELTCYAKLRQLDISSLLLSFGRLENLSNQLGIVGSVLWISRYRVASSDTTVMQFESFLSFIVHFFKLTLWVVLNCFPKRFLCHQNSKMNKLGLIKYIMNQQQKCFLIVQTTASFFYFSIFIPLTIQWQ